LEADVRWPNDLYLYGKKLGGVLCEMKANQRTIRYLVMGIGINVNQKGKDFSGSLRGSVTSLRLETGREWDREALAEALYDRVEFWYRSLQNQGRNALVSTLEGLHGGSEAEWRRLRETMRNV
jgi:BirA family biotin operon repressor/biotin-[acetyl-CoA-carboxylase] ligase